MCPVFLPFLKFVIGHIAAMLPLPNSKTNKNVGQNCSTYSFTITKPKSLEVEKPFAVLCSKRVCKLFNS